MTNHRTVLAALLLSACFAVTAFAHHATTGVYDTSKGVTLTGLITSLDWRNPHSSIAIDAKNAGGKVTNWRVELASTAILMKAGLDKDSIDLTKSKSCSMEVFPAKDGSPNAVGVTLTFDGKTFDVIAKATPGGTRGQ